MVLTEFSTESDLLKYIYSILIEISDKAIWSWRKLFYKNRNKNLFPVGIKCHDFLSFKLIVKRCLLFSLSSIRPFNTLKALLCIDWDLEIGNAISKQNLIQIRFRVLTSIAIAFSSYDLSEYKKVHWIMNEWWWYGKYVIAKTQKKNWENLPTFNLANQLDSLSGLWPVRWLLVDFRRFIFKGFSGSLSSEVEKRNQGSHGLRWMYWQQ